MIITKLFGFLLISSLGLFTTAVSLAAEDKAANPAITIYKTPTCGCCALWVDYLEDNGFNTIVHDLDDLSAIKKQHGMHDARLHSCHTAIIEGYVVEGHVPANDIWRLLTERPDIRGITAPGMPQYSPGMASLIPRGYDVISFDDEGQLRYFSRY